MNGICTRLAAAGGAFYVVAVGIGSPMLDSTSPAVVDTGWVLIILSFLAFAVFVGVLHPVLRGVEAGEGSLATVALVVGMLHAASRFELLAAERGAIAAPADLAKGLEPLHEYGFVVSLLLLGLYVACVAGICLVHGLFPRWLGWVGSVAGTLAVGVGIAGLVDIGLVLPWPFLAAGLWLFVFSGLLATRPDAPRRSSQVTVAASRTDMAGAV